MARPSCRDADRDELGPLVLLGDRLAILRKRLEETADGVLCHGDRLGARLALGDATGQRGNGHGVAALLLVGIQDDRVLALSHSWLSDSQQIAQLVDTEARLVQDAGERFRLDNQTRVPRNRHQSGFGWMLQEQMPTALVMLVPAIPSERAQQLGSGDPRLARAHSPSSTRSSSSVT